MICKHCFQTINQQVGDNKKDFTPPCKFNAVKVVTEIDPIKLKAIASAIGLAKGKEVVVEQVPRSYSGPHELVDFNKWWDDQVRCTTCGYHHFNKQLGPGYYLTYGPHQPHTITGRYVYPVYITPLGETVLGDYESKGGTAYRDQWETVKEYDKRMSDIRGRLTSQKD